MKKKFYVAVEVPFLLEAIVEAKNAEEAMEKARQMKPEDFHNFLSFYEWLGSNWEEISTNLIVQEMGSEKPEIVEWRCTFFKETHDYLNYTTEGKRIIEGVVRYAGKTGKFRFEELWTDDNVEKSVEVDIDLPDDLKREIEEFIVSNSAALFSPR